MVVVVVVRLTQPKYDYYHVMKLSRFGGGRARKHAQSSITLFPKGFMQNAFHKLFFMFRRCLYGKDYGRNCPGSKLLDVQGARLRSSVTFPSPKIFQHVIYHSVTIVIVFGLGQPYYECSVRPRVTAPSIIAGLLSACS